MLLGVSDLNPVFILSLMCNSGHVAWLHRINSSCWKLIKIICDNFVWESNFLDFLFFILDSFSQIFLFWRGKQATKDYLKDDGFFPFSPSPSD